VKFIYRLAWDMRKILATRDLNSNSREYFLDSNGQHGHFIYYIAQYCISPILYYKGDEF